MKRYIAVDLGATSGRVVVGNLQEAEEVHRFPTPSVMVLDELYWDILAIYDEVLAGIRKALEKYDDVVSIGIDSWGVDYALIDEAGSLISPVYNYRDTRTHAVIDEVCTLAGGWEELFRKTGVGIESFNTVFQLYAQKKRRPVSFSSAASYLSVPDLLSYWLTGVKKNELSHASTTQLLDAETNDWRWDLIDRLGFRRSLFGEIVYPGTVLGPLRSEVKERIGVRKDILVIAAASHDTASAAAAIPSVEKRPLFLSSGTWSIIGVELKKPLLSPEAYRSGFSNEKGTGGGTLLLKNIMGMWIQNECLKYFKSFGEEYTWERIQDLVLGDKEYMSYINPLDERFMAPDTPSNHMTERITSYCRETGQKEPENIGQYLRCIYHGLAKAYRKAVEDLEKASGLGFDTIYVIGGGCRNVVLNDWTAKETGMTVIAGPAEATAEGNILIQALASGEIESIGEGRKKVRETSRIKVFFSLSHT